MTYIGIAAIIGLNCLAALWVYRLRGGVDSALDIREKLISEYRHIDRGEG